MGMHNVAAATMAGQVLAQDRKWTAHAVFVLMANASLDKENEDGLPPRQFFMSQAAVAEILWGEATPATEQQVKRAIQTLRAAGLLREIRRAGNGRVGRYELLFEPVDIVMEAASYAARYAVKEPKIAARSAKAKATVAAKRAAEAADEAALAEVAAVVDTVALMEVGGHSETPNEDTLEEVGGRSATSAGGRSATSAGGRSATQLQVVEGPPLRGRGKRRNLGLREENNSPEVSTSPAAVDTMADNDDDENGDEDDVRSHWHKVAKREAERAGTRTPGGTVGT